MLSVRERMWGVTVERRRPRRGTGGARRVTLPRKGEQATFADLKTWGGPRPGSGPKPGLRPNVRHRTRADHRAACPVHVTLRRAKGLPSLRSDRLHRLVRESIRATRRDDFRIVHYSVQADHVHLIVEADTPIALTNGMRSFAVRVAMRVNHRVLLRRRGRVWGDRHHRRELTTPGEVRSVLVYVLNNHLKHGEYDVGLVDPLSSAPWFDGWQHRRDPKPPEPPAARPPSTWLLDQGWSTAGLGYLNVGEVPRALRR